MLNIQVLYILSINIDYACVDIIGYGLEFYKKLAAATTVKSHLFKINIIYYWKNQNRLMRISHVERKTILP